MKIEFREVFRDRIDDYILISKWANDESIKHLSMPNFTEADLPYVSAEEFFNGALKKSAEYNYMILADNVPVGEFSVQIDPPQLHKKVKNTGWIGISIGEENYRGKGIGKPAMLFLENKCRELNLVRIELGVFAFNHSAIKFYQKMGYTQFAVLKNFTFYQGGWHDDIRMEKYLC